MIVLFAFVFLFLGVAYWLFQPGSFFCWLMFFLAGVCLWADIKHIFCLIAGIDPDPRETKRVDALNRVIQLDIAITRGVMLKQDTTELERARDYWRDILMANGGHDGKGS